MYMILKPEMRNYIHLIEDFIFMDGFKVCSKHIIPDWGNLAMDLYSPQIKQDGNFASEFDCYIWLTQKFFGNNAIVLLLDRPGSVLANLKELSRLKQKFRLKVSEDLGDAIYIFLNLNNINGKIRHNNGIEGRLNVSDNSSFNFQGRWDYFFFKYIHTPDVDIEAYNREMGVLEKNSILEKELALSEWETMKQTQTMIPQYFGKR